MNPVATFKVVEQVATLISTLMLGEHLDLVALDDVVRGPAADLRLGPGKPIQNVASIVYPDEFTRHGHDQHAHVGLGRDLDDDREVMELKSLQPNL